MRKCGSGTITVYGSEKRDGAPQTFRILRVREESADAVCYEAEAKEQGTKGLLWEYYPVDLPALKRGPDGQLYISRDVGMEAERFHRKRWEVTAVYQAMQEIRAAQTSGGRPCIIPPTRIYTGGEGRRSFVRTVYLYAPDSGAVVFREICDEIHRRAYCGGGLTFLLEVFIELTKGMQLLHERGLRFPCISPHTVGLKKGACRDLPKDVVILDPGKVYSAFSDGRCIFGAEGFMTGELMQSGPTIGTDIYGLGGLLFYAVTGNTYHYRDYHRIAAMTAQSELLPAKAWKQEAPSAASVTASDPLLCAQAGKPEAAKPGICAGSPEPGISSDLSHAMTASLIHILQKCLCGRSHRYPNCLELLRDLEQLRKFDRVN